MPSLNPAGFCLDYGIHFTQYPNIVIKRSGTSFDSDKSKVVPVGDVSYVFNGEKYLNANSVTISSKDGETAPWVEYVNSRFGFSIRYPSKLLVPQGESGNGDGQGFISQDKQTKLSAYGSHTLLGETLKDDFEKELQAYPNSQITYRVLRNNWYVISGTDRGLIFYRKTVQVRDGYATFNFSFPIEHRGTWDKVLVELAKGFKAKE